MTMENNNESSDLAHVARQRQESAAPNGIKATMRHDAGAMARCSYCGRYSLDPATLSDRQPICECGKQHGWSGSFVAPDARSKWSGKAPTPSAAVAEGVDTALPPPALTVADEPGRGHYYSAEQMAQQREAGRRDSRVELLDVLARLATAQQQLIDANAEIISANAGMHPNLAPRQPVSEGLTEAAVIEMFKAAGLPVQWLGEASKPFTNGSIALAEIARALSAAPPAKAEGMSDQAMWDAAVSETGTEHNRFRGECIVLSSPEEVGDVFRTILAQQAKGASNV